MYFADVTVMNPKHYYKPFYHGRIDIENTNQFSEAMKAVSALKRKNDWQFFIKRKEVTYRCVVKLMFDERPARVIEKEIFVFQKWG